MPLHRLLTVVSIVAGLSACTNPARREAASLTDAIDRYRHATDSAES